MAENDIKDIGVIVMLLCMVLLTCKISGDTAAIRALQNKIAEQGQTSSNKAPTTQPKEPA